MRRKLVLTIIICLALPLLALSLAGCVPAAAATIAVDPPIFQTDMTIHPDYKLPMALLMPITFNGSGWAPGETVAIDLEIPPDVEIPGVEPGQKYVGIAFAVADEDGNIETAMDTTTKLFTVLRVDMPAVGQIEFVRPPIPAGVYTIRATGGTSGAVGTTTIEFVTPAE